MDVFKTIIWEYYLLIIDFFREMAYNYMNYVKLLRIEFQCYWRCNSGIYMDLDEYNIPSESKEGVWKLISIN